MIVAGSYYDNKNVNTTVVFLNENAYFLPKLYPSPHEPMFLSKTDIEEPLNIIYKWEKQIAEGNIPDYFFNFQGKYAVILNCIDYYKLGYYVARSSILSKDLLFLLSPCSNNRVEVFLDESKAIHNHNVNIYSLIVNAYGSLDNDAYAIGKSYFFGVIDPFTNDHQYKKDLNIKHASSIAHVEKGSKAIFVNTIDDFNLLKRSDLYRKNPSHIEIIQL